MYQTKETQWLDRKIFGLSQRISCIHEHLLLTQEIVKNTDMVNNSPQMHMTLTAFCEGDNS